jgi:hypothetical protein
MTDDDGYTVTYFECVACGLVWTNERRDDVRK